MEKIEPKNNLSNSELESRVNWFVKRADEILKLSHIDSDEAIKQCRALRDFSDSEYHELTLHKNSKYLDKSENLRIYEGYFIHLHFGGRVTQNNLDYNLDEFNQGYIGHKWFKKSK